MASISRIPSGKWRARYYDETGRQHASHHARKVDAQRWIDEQTAGLVTGNYVHPGAGRVTFAEFFADWSARQVWARGTTVSAQQAADCVTFGSVPMRQIKPSHIEQWIKEMSIRLAPSTIRTRFNYVHMAFRAAVRDRVISIDPSESVRLPKLRRADAAMTIPTPEQVGVALDVAPREFRAFVALCAFAGLRLGEAAALRVDDVDFLRRTISIRRQIQGQTSQDTVETSPKHGSERVVFIPPALVDLVAEHVHNVGVHGPERRLFGSPARPLNRNSAGHLWRRTREDAGLSEFTLHDLRHFFASGLIASGCDVVTVQHALGHSDPTTTLRVYAHLWPKAEDRTRDASAGLMRAVLEDFSRTQAVH